MLESKGQIEIQSKNARRRGKDQNPTQKLRENENSTRRTVPKNPKKITGDTQMPPNSAEQEMTRNDQNSARYQAMTAQWPKMTAQNGSRGYVEEPQMHAWQESGLEIAKWPADNPQNKGKPPGMTEITPAADAALPSWPWSGGQWAQQWCVDDGWNLMALRSVRISLDGALTA